MFEVSQMPSGDRGMFECVMCAGFHTELWVLGGVTPKLGVKTVEGVYSI